MQYNQFTPLSSPMVVYIRVLNLTESLLLAPQLVQIRVLNLIQVYSLLIKGLLTAPQSVQIRVRNLIQVYSLLIGVYSLPHNWYRSGY